MKIVKKTGKITSKIIKLLLTVVVFLLVPYIGITLVSSNTDILAGMKSFVVVSGSMEPAIPTGSIIYTVQKSFYNNSDVIAFNQDGRVITHRIVGIEPIGNEIFYKTKGDANNVEDSSLVNRNDIVGATMVSLPTLGKVVTSFKTPIGFAAGIVLPALLFIGMELWSIKREIEKATERRVMDRISGLGG